MNLQHFMFCILIVLLYFMFSAESTNNFLEIELIRHKSAFHRLLEMGIHPAAVGKMFGKHVSKPKPKPKKDRTNDTVQLFKYMDSEYYGEILLGRPGQRFKVVFDTAWGDSFVPSKQCSYFNVACRNHEKYDSTRSSTYIPNNKPFEMNISGQSMAGFFSTDTLHIGHISVTNHTFAEITQLPNLFLSSKADGIFGMGFPALADNVSKPFFFNIINQYPNIPHIFSFYMNRDITTEKGGSLIFGAISKKHYTGNITYIPLNGVPYWQVKMDKVYFKNPMNELCATGCNAIFDTGSSVIEVPPTNLTQLNRRIGAYLVPGTNRYQVDCIEVLKLPTIYFQIQNTVFKLKGKEYIQEIDVGPYHNCTTAFVESPKTMPDLWTLGGAFMYRYYTIFDVDKQQIGLATANL
ncbi:lysosomal aspartic protease-like [Lycorma delicatula]|uniref:lysosomal aspartic protease-like n=1 Tax=Lycorma delicatula TaxID=130591 RepID=UPI003F519F37